MLERIVNLRRKMFVEPQLQRKLIGNFIILGLIMTLVNSITFYLIFNHMVNQMEGMDQLNSEVSELFLSTWRNIVTSSSILSVAIVVGFCLYGLYFSNRIAGPIFNLRRSINSLLNDNPNVQISFRKNDYFHDISDLMNQLIKKFQKK